jgi:ankyrin repeat protein/serine/threonine protein kinase/frataxin-like iron-binding protein CyaY
MPTIGDKGNSPRHGIALVIGIGKFDDWPGSATNRPDLLHSTHSAQLFPKPENDMKAVADAAAMHGYDVLRVEDPTKSTLQEKVREVCQLVRAMDLDDEERAVVMVYYSGHGLQMKSMLDGDAGAHGTNFIVCRDTAMIPQDVVDEAVAAEGKGDEDATMETKYKHFQKTALRLHEDIITPIHEAAAERSSGTIMKLVVLDCCRDDPGIKCLGRTRGFGGLWEQMPAAFGDHVQNTIIAYAVSCGERAGQLNAEQFGIYTGLFLDAMWEKGPRYVPEIIATFECIKARVEARMAEPQLVANIAEGEMDHQHAVNTVHEPKDVWGGLQWPAYGESGGRTRSLGELNQRQVEQARSIEDVLGSLDGPELFSMFTRIIFDRKVLHWYLRQAFRAAWDQKYKDSLGHASWITMATADRGTMCCDVASVEGGPFKESIASGNDAKWDFAVLLFLLVKSDAPLVDAESKQGKAVLRIQDLYQRAFGHAATSNMSRDDFEAACADIRSLIKAFSPEDTCQAFDKQIADVASGQMYASSGDEVMRAYWQGLLKSRDDKVAEQALELARMDKKLIRLKSKGRRRAMKLEYVRRACELRGDPESAPGSSSTGTVEAPWTTKEEKWIVRKVKAKMEELGGDGKVGVVGGTLDAGKKQRADNVTKADRLLKEKLGVEKWELLRLEMEERVDGWRVAQPKKGGVLKAEVHVEDAESMEPYSGCSFTSEEEAWLQRKVKNKIDGLLKEEVDQALEEKLGMERWEMLMLEREERVDEWRVARERSRNGVLDAEVEAGSMEPYSGYEFNAEEEAWLQLKVKQDIDEILAKADLALADKLGKKRWHVMNRTRKSRVRELRNKREREEGRVLVTAVRTGISHKYVFTADEEEWLERKVKKDTAVDGSEEHDVNEALALTLAPQDEAGGGETKGSAGDMSARTEREWAQGLQIKCYGDLILTLVHPDRRLENGGFGIVYQMDRSDQNTEEQSIGHLEPMQYAVKRPKRRQGSMPLPVWATTITDETTAGGGAEMSEAMQEEAQIILQVPPHENVLDLVDIAHVNRVPVLITPWGDGGSLSTFLASKAGDERDGSGGDILSANLALGLAIQLCRGLRHLHDNGVVHYDLKPANIIIFTPASGHNKSSIMAFEKYRWNLRDCPPVDKRCVLKVADFGLSRGMKDWLTDGNKEEETEDDGGESGTGGSGGVGANRRINGGTPGYRAPELGMSQSELECCGGECIDKRMTVADANKAVDLWALGLVVGYLASPVMWGANRGAWFETDRLRKKQLRSAKIWQEGIATHCELLRVTVEDDDEETAETKTTVDSEGGAADDAVAAAPLCDMVNNVALPCLALAGANRPSAAECEVRLCSMEKGENREAQWQNFTMVKNRGVRDDTETTMREARFWSYFLGTPDARERACKLWDSLPEADRDFSPPATFELAAPPRTKEYFQILARCKGSEERTAQAVALLGKMKTRLSENDQMLTFACEEGDDNVAIVRGYLDVMVERHRLGGEAVGGTAGADNAAEWSCSACTLINAPSLITCSMCGNKRSNAAAAVAVGGSGVGDNGDRGGAEDQGDWKCVLCETMNENGQHGCQFCGEYRAAIGQPSSTAVPDSNIDIGVIRADIVRRADYGGEKMTALHVACRAGRTEVARFLIATGGVELVRMETHENATALHLASEYGNLEVARILIEAGGVELVRAVDDRNYTALHLACTSRQGETHLEVARLLVEVGGAEFLNAVTYMKKTALHLACLNDPDGHFGMSVDGRSEVVRFLIKAGGVKLVRAVDVNGCTALHWACQGGYLEIARFLVGVGGAELVKVANVTNDTAFHLACSSGHLEVAQFLVEVSGVDLLRVNGRENSTALHFACMSGHPGVVRYLIEMGGVELARVVDDTHLTALHLACQGNYPEIVCLLIEAGGVGYVNVVNDRNQTALHMVCRQGHLEVARLLVEAGGAELVKAVGDMNVTALHFACFNGHLDVARLLVEAGSVELVRVVDDRNQTALHLACEAGHLEVARLINDEGAEE